MAKVRNIPVILLVSKALIYFPPILAISFVLVHDYIIMSLWCLFQFYYKYTVPVSTDASQGNTGEAIAGGLIAVIVAVVVLVLVILFAVCWIKRRARTKSNSYTMFE